MYFGRKPRRFRAAAPQKSPTIAPQAPLDLWLQRIGLISQVGLFLFTVGTIYFTVIPLYQKALLDEQIAQKQIELEKLTSALNSAYVKIRSSAVNTYVFHAGAKCSGLMINPSSTAGGGAKVYADSILEIKPEDCLSQELSAGELKGLNPADLALLKSKVIEIGKLLEELRQKGLSRMADAPQAAKAITTKFPTSGTARVIALEQLKGQSPEFQRELLAKIAVDQERVAVDQERMNAADEYSKSVRSQVLTLNDIEWPSPKHVNF